MKNYKQWIPNAIRALRESNGLTQEELGKLCGFASSGTISHFETGARVPSLESLNKIFMACGVEMRLGFDSPENNSIDGWIYVRKSELTELVKIAKRIDPDVDRTE